MSSPSRESREEGIPVNDPLAISKCSACHARDAQGNMTRISWIRTTPEGWEEAIKRMVRLQGAVLQPDEAGKILRYLSEEHGLAPEEAKPVAYMAEQRMIDEDVPSEDIARACKSCHALGKALSWRRSADDWKMLVNTHLALYPDAEMFAFQRPGHRRDIAPSAPGAPPPVEQALQYLAKNAPLHSAAWAQWRASMRTPQLAGRWLVSGSQAGKGRFFGEMVVSPSASGEAFSTRTRIAFVRDGAILSEAGSALVYTGYAWRGRSKTQNGVAAADAPTSVREAMMLSRDQLRMEGRWFWGAYHEFGMDVNLRRAGDGPTVAGVDVTSLKAGTAGSQVRIYGDNFPPDITAADLDLGSGVMVGRIVSQQPGILTVSVDVAKDAIPGRRDVAVRHSVAPGAFAVYDHIDFLKITPQTALARLGGGPPSKGYCQFEAIAYSNGADGKPYTADDIELGPVPVQWKLEEFAATYGDDDAQFVGTLNPDTGLFTPALDGPNPKRRNSRNNYGDVWVVATFKPSGSSEALTARSYLVVTVAQYLRWDQPEVSP